VIRDIKDFIEAVKQGGTRPVIHTNNRFEPIGQYSALEAV